MRKLIVWKPRQPFPSLGIYHRQLDEPYDNEAIDELVIIHGAKLINSVCKEAWECIAYAQRRF